MVDQACGLVVRYQDENNYYLARANSLEGNVRFYNVLNGRRRQLADWNGPVKAGVWHELVVEARGQTFVIRWDGQRILEVQDSTFDDAGRAGIWTKADSVTYFDDLVVQPFGESPR
ncbi:MAG: hypothetical protein HYZ81_05390 [Nitrospinae bacterium]|nr:hypothetical protein [Nitrospinota bacterium]